MTDRPLRILWTTNIDLPQAAGAVGARVSPFGGWLAAMLDALSQRPELLLGVAMRSETRRPMRVEHGGVIFYAMPRVRRNRCDVSQTVCDDVLKDFSPDLLHAQGSEMAYTARFFRTWRGPRILSLQGILEGIAPYQLGRLDLLSLMSPLRPRTMLFAMAMAFNERFRFRPRLRPERETLRLAHYIVGRTLWDQAHSQAINPNARYIHCGEILRPVFYERTWSMGSCEPRSIFIGNAASPLKGAHIALEAIARLQTLYPELRVYIAGSTPSAHRGLSLRGQFGYPAYLLGLIQKLGLGNRVIFTGALDAPRMADWLARSHLYLLPSLIENSPNTLCEAMLMGVPAVAASVGGVPSIARDGIEALLYRASDPVLLAFQIRRLFDDPALCRSLSSRARERARKAHDALANSGVIARLYRDILSQRSDFLHSCAASHRSRSSPTIALIT